MRCFALLCGTLCHDALYLLLCGGVCLCVVLLYAVFFWCCITRFCYVPLYVVTCCYALLYTVVFGVFCYVLFRVLCVVFC